MVAMMPGFTGGVPPAFQKRYPHVRYTDSGAIDPRDPMYVSVAASHMKAQLDLYGGDQGHWYGADLFAEAAIPAHTNEDEWLANITASTFAGFEKADPGTRWMTSGWK